MKFSFCNFSAKNDPYCKNKISPGDVLFSHPLIARCKGVKCYDCLLSGNKPRQMYFYASFNKIRKDNIYLSKIKRNKYKLYAQYTCFGLSQSKLSVFYHWIIIDYLQYWKVKVSNLTWSKHYFLIEILAPEVGRFFIGKAYAINARNFIISLN